MVSRSWCFTWNNYDDDAITLLKRQPFNYLIYGKETAASGTPHLQGTIVLSKPQRLSYFKKTYGKIPHWEICRNLAASINYCKKEHDYIEIDKRKKRGPKKNSYTLKERKEKFAHALLLAFPPPNLTLSEKAIQTEA